MVFQAQAYSINEQADVFLSGLIHRGNASLSPGFFVLDSQLRFCDHVPKTLSTDSCQVVWNGTVADAKNKKSASKAGKSSITSPDRTTTTSPLPTTVDQSTPTPVALVETLIAHLPTEDPAAPQVDIVGYHRTSLNGRAGVALKNVEVNGKDLTLSHNCLVALNWPVQTYVFPICLIRVICL